MTINDVKRLEQENAELKAKIKKYAAINEQETKDYAELKAENDRLKEENEKLNKMTGIFSARLCEKYRTTLQEIKAIAEEGEKCLII